MDFSEALIRLKAGLLVARKGWNGRGMCLFYVPEGSFSHPVIGGKEHKALPFIAIRDAQNSISCWVPSQADLLGRDWYQVYLYDAPN